MTALTEITPEERAQWREKHTAVPEYYGHRIITLLNALEAAEAQIDFLANVSQPLANLLQEAEARAEKAEAERDVLAKRIVEDNTSFDYGFEFETAGAYISDEEAIQYVLDWAAREVARQAAEKKGGE